MANGNVLNIRKVSKKVSKSHLAEDFGNDLNVFDVSFFGSVRRFGFGSPRPLEKFPQQEAVGVGLVHSQ